MRILIEVDEDYRPEDGDAFDAVVSALDHFEIPSVVCLSDAVEKMDERESSSMFETLKRCEPFLLGASQRGEAGAEEMLARVREILVRAVGEIHDTEDDSCTPHSA